MLWSALPKRNGSNDKKAAYAQWKARRKAWHTTEDMQAGAVRYAAWCRATGKENTETVKQAATFLGPADPPHFMLSWLPPGQTTAAAATEIASRSEEHTSELQSLMRSSYAVFCLKKQKQTSIYLIHEITNM